MTTAETGLSESALDRELTMVEYRLATLLDAEATLADTSRGRIRSAIGGASEGRSVGLVSNPTAREAVMYADAPDTYWWVAPMRQALDLLPACQREAIEACCIAHECVSQAVYAARVGVARQTVMAWTAAGKAALAYWFLGRRAERAKQEVQERAKTAQKAI